MLELIFLMSFLTFFLLIYQTAKMILKDRKHIERLKRYTGTEEGRGDKKHEKDRPRNYRAGLHLLAKGVGSARFLNGYKRAVQLQLTQAHVLLKAEEYITICMAAFLAAALLFQIVFHSFPLSLGGGITGWMLPSFFLKSRIKARIKILNDQLGDAILLISNSLKAGYSFFQAVDLIVREMNGPIAQEFGILQREVNLGQSTEKALENLVDRVRSDDLELLVTAVLIQRQVGGNLAEVLDNISSTIRERIRMKGEVKTLTAQGRMSGIIISVLPVILGLLLFIINPQHMSLLFKEQLGIAIIVGSVLMEFVGILFIRKIVRIEM